MVDDPVIPEIHDRIAAVLVALGDRLKTFSDILKLGKFFFQDQIDYDPDAFKKRLCKADVPKILTEVSELFERIDSFDTATLDKAVHQYVETSGRGMGLVVNALRVATTGQAIGPGVYEAIEILGRDECLKRIALTLSILPKS